jgi:chromosome partitioning protein
MMKTIAIVNTKGGCGKTTTAINLAASIGWKGLPVLLIDMDPQGHATLGVNVNTENEPGLYEVYSEQMSIDEVIIPDVVAGIDLLPATRNLNEAENILSNYPYDQVLRHHLAQLDNKYDFAIIDCAPTLGPLTLTALLAADELLVPVEMSLFSLDSIEKLYQAIHALEEEHEIIIPIKVLPTMVDTRTRLARAFMRSIWERFADDVLPIMVHNTVRVREAVCKGLPIIDYDANSPAAYDYKRLADEIIQNSDPDFMHDEIRKVSTLRVADEITLAQI